ncbi:hypothetical protein Tco_1168385 [Tanacetum coccineum]
MLAMNKIATATGSNRLKPSANELIQMRKKSGLELNILAKYDENDQAKPTAPATASNRMLPEKQQTDSKLSSLIHIESRKVTYNVLFDDDMEGECPCHCVYYEYHSECSGKYSPFDIALGDLITACELMMFNKCLKWKCVLDEI